MHILLESKETDLFILQFLSDGDWQGIGISNVRDWDELGFLSNWDWGGIELTLELG